jgi:hypothetical protein
LIVGDPNLRDFYGRVTRIEEARANGFGFEAPGTIGLSHYRKKKRSGSRLLGPLFLAVVMALGLKGAIHYKVGAATYDKRVETLMSGGTVDRVGGWLMQADPATLWVSRLFQELAG